MTHAFWRLVRKDLVLFASDRRALLLSLAAPIIIAAFFGFLFSAPADQAARVPVAVIDGDGSEISRAVVAGLGGEDMLTLQPLAEADAMAQLRAGKLRAVVVLPAAFGRQAAAAFFGPGPKPEITLHHDPSQAMALAIVRGLLSQHVMQVVGAAAISGTGAGGQAMAALREGVVAGTGMGVAQRRELVDMFDAIERVQRRTAQAAGAASAGAAAPSIGQAFTLAETAMTSGTKRPYNSYAHSFAGMGVQFVLMMGIDLGVGLLAMRRQGLWQRLRAAPVSRALLLGSRAASGAIIAALLMLAIFAAARLLFDVRIEGSWLGFAGITIAFALMTATFGLMIAALGRTPEATRGLAILATLLLVMLGGAWVPAFIFPQWLQTVSLFVPTRWAVDGYDAMTWRGLPLADALAPIGVMLGFSALFALLAVRRFRWQE